MKSPGKCIFCDRTGLSKQHMWPDWLGKVVPRIDTTHTQIQLLIENSFENSFSIYPPTVKKRQGHPGVIKLRKVCIDCNRGWMSQLEQLAKPHLINLILGKDIEITKEIQSILCRWLVMTTIVAEYSDPRTAATPKSQRHQFYLDQATPKGWSMWIGKYKGDQWKQRYFHSGIAVSTLSELQYFGKLMQANVQCSTFVIGNLALLAISTTHPAINFESHKLGLNKKMFQLFPFTASFEWMDAEILRDIEMNLVSLHFQTQLRQSNALSSSY